MTNSVKAFSLCNDHLMEILDINNCKELQLTITLLLSQKGKICCATKKQLDGTAWELLW